MGFGAVGIHPEGELVLKKNSQILIQKSKSFENKHDKSMKKNKKNSSRRGTAPEFSRKLNKGITSKLPVAQLSIIRPLLLMIILVSFVAAKDTVCRFLNRDWNNNVPENCFGSISDCGNCTKGYSENHYGKCSPKLEVVEVSNNDVVNAPFGIAMLTCRLPKRGDCLWTRNGHQVVVNGRYKYLDWPYNGIATIYCSILIENIDRSVDTGHYTCRTKPDSSGRSTTSFKATILEAVPERAVIVSKSDQMAHATLGDTVIILCHLPINAQCVWRRGKNVVDISKNYDYVDANGDHFYTTDCSIRIRKFREIDANQWTCSGLPRSSHHEEHSRATVLKLVSPPSVIESPKNASTSIGGGVVLSCKFNTQVQCIWIHNGSVVAVTDRVRLNQTMGDCSISIRDVTKDDAGSWICSYKGSQHDQYSNLVLLSVLTVFPGISPTTPNNANESSEARDSSTITEKSSPQVKTASSLNAATIVAICLAIIVIALLGVIIWSYWRSRKHRSYSLCLVEPEAV